MARKATTAPTEPASRIVLLENGKALGPAHALHDEIRTLGQGRYSHWGKAIYFTASDNTDPRKNGRSYSITITKTLGWQAPLLLGVLLALLCLAPGNKRGVITRAKTNLQAALFDLPLKVVGLIVSAGAAATLAIACVAAPETGADILEALRTILRTSAASAFAFAAGAMAVLSLRGERKPVWRGLLGALVLFLLAGGFVTQFAGFWQAAILGLVAALMSKAAPIKQTIEALKHRWAWLQRFDVAIGIGCAAALIVCLPEIVRYWDQSGWMDSYGYDNYAHGIARGSAPFGDSSYMPLYQYGMAAIYWTFGHFFFLQQIVNLAFAALCVVAFAAAARHFFDEPFIPLLAAIIAALWPNLHHAPWYTQIENWYVPIFAVTLWALGRYRLRQSYGAVLVLALAAALLLNTRLQALFYAAALGLTPLVLTRLGWAQRAKHMLVFFAALAT